MKQNAFLNFQEIVAEVCFDAITIVGMKIRCGYSVRR